jgi:hypothetical protein
MNKITPPTPEQTKEIGMWLNPSKFDNPKTKASIYILSRILKGEKQNIDLNKIYDFLPGNRKDVICCFNLYDRCSYIKENIAELFQDKLFGVFPFYKILFTNYEYFRFDCGMLDNYDCSPHKIIYNKIEQYLTDFEINYEKSKDAHTIKQGMHSLIYKYDDPQESNLPCMYRIMYDHTIHYDQNSINKYSQQKIYPIV